MCNYLLDKMTAAIQGCEPSFETMTYVPYYDASIIQDNKNLLGEVAMNQLILTKVDALQL